MANEPDGELIGKDVVRFTRRLPGPITRVWDFITGSDHLSAWIGNGVIEPRVGGKVDIDGHISGNVVEWSRPQRLSYTWVVGRGGDGGEKLTSLLIFDLAEEGDDVVLTLTHGKQLPGFHALSMMGWFSLLNALEAAIAGKPAPDRGQNFQRVLPVYEARVRDQFAFGEYEANGSTIRFQRFFPVPVERVWSFIADDKLRAQWTYEGVIEPRVGGKVALGHAMKGVVTEYAPPHTLAFTWQHPKSEGGWASDESYVRLEITQTGPGALLTLTHSAMVGSDRDANAAGWHAHLDILAAIVRGQPKPVLLETERKVRAVYQVRLI